MALPVYYKIVGKYHYPFRVGFGALGRAMNYNDQRYLVWDMETARRPLKEEVDTSLTHLDKETFCRFHLHGYY